MRISGRKPRFILTITTVRHKERGGRERGGREREREREREKKKKANRETVRKRPPWNFGGHDLLSQEQGR